MLAYIARRTLIAVFTILVISFLSYIIIELPPGDVVDRYVYFEFYNEPAPTPEEAEALREQFGLNAPAVLPWWSWTSGIVLRADFGKDWDDSGNRSHKVSRAAG